MALVSVDVEVAMRRVEDEAAINNVVDECVRVGPFCFCCG
jgi:hypothetical protein